MKKYQYFYSTQMNAAEDGESLVKRCLWVAVIVAALLVVQHRLNIDSEKFHQEQEYECSINRSQS